MDTKYPIPNSLQIQLYRNKHSAELYISVFQFITAKLFHDFRPDPNAEQMLIQEYGTFSRTAQDVCSNLINQNPGLIGPVIEKVQSNQLLSQSESTLYAFLRSLGIHQTAMDKQLDASTTVSQPNRHIHSSERPFHCPQEGCNYASRRRYLLGMHMRRHSDQWPFHCPREGCDKSFKQKEPFTETYRDS